MRTIMSQFKEDARQSFNNLLNSLEYAPIKAVIFGNNTYVTIPAESVKFIRAEDGFSVKVDVDATAIEKLQIEDKLYWTIIGIVEERQEVLFEKKFRTSFLNIDGSLIEYKFEFDGGSSF